MSKSEPSKSIRNLTECTASQTATVLPEIQGTKVANGGLTINKCYQLNGKASKRAKAWRGAKGAEVAVAHSLQFVQHVTT